MGETADPVADGRLGDDAGGSRSAAEGGIADGVGQLLTVGLFVQDGFLSPGRVGALSACAQARRARGEFGAARMGGGANLTTQIQVRGDITCWWEEPLFEAERALLADFERLRRDVNGHAFLGLFDLELHYAVYAPGAGYARHVDQLRGCTERRVSLVLYLNESWTAEDGGQLRLFDADGGHRDIEPLGGRLVCFLTEGREHAVLPARRERSSISGWFRARGEREPTA